MAITNPSTAFSAPKFLIDVTKLADKIQAPYSEARISEVLETFKECFKDAIVAWRTTDRPGDTLNYRIFLRRQLDTISIPIKGGLLRPDKPLVRLVTSWSSLNNGATEQWCDFDPNAGLVKTWVNWKGSRPIDDILNASEVPATIRSHSPNFHSLGLKMVTFVAVDYRGNTVNLYFVAPGPVSQHQAAQYTNLAGCSPPTDLEFRDMLQFLHPQGYHFAVTMDYSSGRITRVAFYALDLPQSHSPAMDDRISEFFVEASSYDERQTRVVAWSHGLGGSKYMKAESSCSGELATLSTLVDATMPSS